MSIANLITVDLVQVKGGKNDPDTGTLIGILQSEYDSCMHLFTI